jgi:transposase-like protein
MDQNFDSFPHFVKKLSGPKLVASDAHRGIRAVISRQLQGAAWQRCRVHYKREMGRKVSYKRLKELN